MPLGRERNDFLIPLMLIRSEESSGKPISTNLCYFSINCIKSNTVAALLFRILPPPAAKLLNLGKGKYLLQAVLENQDQFSAFAGYAMGHRVVSTEAWMWVM